MKKRILTWVMALAVCFSMLGGCGSGEKTPSENTDEQEAPAEEAEMENAEAEGTKTEKGMRLGFIVDNLNGIYAEFVERMASECEQRGVEWTVKAAKTTGERITALENFVQTKMDVVILHVSDTEALDPYVQSAQEAGVKIIAYDQDTPTSDAYYGCQNFDYGYAIAKNACDWINETFEPDETVKVAICNYPIINFTVEREEGLRAAFADNTPNAEIVAVAMAGSRDEGVTNGETWLQSNPDINVVVGINDDGVLGVYEAFKAAGYEGDKIGLFAGDAIQDACQAVKSGGIFRTTVSTEMVNQSPLFVDLAAELYLNGEATEHDHYFPNIPVTRENVDDYLE